MKITCMNRNIMKEFSFWSVYINRWLVAREESNVKLPEGVKIKQVIQKKQDRQLYAAIRLPDAREVLMKAICEGIHNGYVLY